MCLTQAFFSPPFYLTVKSVAHKCPLKLKLDTGDYFSLAIKLHIELHVIFSINSLKNTNPLLNKTSTENVTRSLS